MSATPIVAKGLTREEADQRRASFVALLDDYSKNTGNTTKRSFLLHALTGVNEEVVGKRVVARAITLLQMHAPMLDLITTNGWVAAYDLQCQLCHNKGTIVRFKRERPPGAKGTTEEEWIGCRWCDRATRPRHSVV